LTVVEQFPVLAEYLNEDFFVEKLNPIYLAWFSDSIYSIREAAINNVKQLAVIFGPQWVVRNVLPKLLGLHTDNNYLHRLTPLFAIVVLTPVLNNEVIKQHFYPVLVNLSKDKVPNIRMNVAKTLSKVYTHVKTVPDINDKFKQLLVDLSRDIDIDVQYYANRGLRESV